MKLIPSLLYVGCLLSGTAFAQSTVTVTLGGASINADSPWLGKWTRLPAGQSGQYTVKAPTGAAAIVRISTQ